MCVRVCIDIPLPPLRVQANPSCNTQLRLLLTLRVGARCARYYGGGGSCDIYIYIYVCVCMYVYACIYVGVCVYIEREVFPFPYEQPSTPP